MNFSRFRKLPVVDCHVHPWPPWRANNKLNELALKTKSLELTETINRGQLNQMHIYGNPDHSALYLKATNPDLFYVGGYAPWSFEATNWNETDWPGYVASLMELGYDGIGEMGAKPVTRDKHTPLDSPVYSRRSQRERFIGWPAREGQAAGRSQSSSPILLRIPCARQGEVVDAGERPSVGADVIVALDNEELLIRANLARKVVPDVHVPAGFVGQETYGGGDGRG